MTRLVWMSLCAAICAASIHPAQAFVRGKPVHALSLHGEPKYGPDFKNFDYVNPNAPKGGTLVMSTDAGTFDTLNGFTLKGTPVFLSGIMHDTLMSHGMDEPFSMYCQICETVEVATDNTWVEFKLRASARFSDGSPITAEDVSFSFSTLIEKGAPVYKLYWPDVAKVEVKDKQTVRFVFKHGNNGELPAILGQLPVIPKSYWSKRDFTATTLDIPVVSGPYTVDIFEVGRNIVYKRVEKYWGETLPVHRGTHNFDRIRVEYFRDSSVQFESFKSGGFDYFFENTARRWATGYDFPAAKDGRVVKFEAVDGSPMNYQSIILNLRRPLFQDRRVRQALGLAFDFESLNKTIFYNQYIRLRSYFQKSDLEPKGLPSPAELALLEPLRDKIPAEVFTQEFQQAPGGDQTALRNNLLKARDLLMQAGWTLKDGTLTKDGKPFAFELLSNSPTLETVLSPWLKNLERLGIKGTLRIIDTTQFVNRMNDYDFDATSLAGANSLSPGNEQSEFWGSDAAGRPGSRNYSGVKDPAVDALITQVVNAKDREGLVAASRALDRVLTWNYYRILTYSGAVDRHAYWAKLKRPDKVPLLGWGAGAGTVAYWWMDPAAAKAGAKP